MYTKDERNFIKKCMGFTPIFFVFALLFIGAFLLIGQFTFPDESEVLSTDCRLFDTQWYHVLENGEKVAVEVPGQVPAQWGEVVTLTTTLPKTVYAGQSICFRPIWQDVAIYVEDELRAEYTTKESRPFGKNSAFRCVFVDLSESDAGKELVYQFSSESKYAGTIRNSYIGDRASIWFYFMEEYGGKAALAFFLAFLTLFCIVVCIIFRVVYKKTLDLNYLAWAIFLCSMWMLSETEFRQIIFRNVSVLTNSTYWALMLIPFPMLLYMNQMQKGRYEKLYTIGSLYSMGVLVIGTLLQIFDIVQFVQQLPFMHIGIGFTVLSIIVTITIDAFKGRIREYLAVGIGIYGMLFSAILELILYYVNIELSLGATLVFGLMFLLVMAVIKTGQDLLSSEKKKQQAIMAREAQAKFLANMSHEIRTPINAVIGMNEMILRESEDEAVQGYAQNIHSASNMLLELVNDILDFSKIESGRLELVENTYLLAALIRDEKLLLNARVGGKPISTKIEVDSKIPSRLLGDELRIKQILTNLLSNAVKYTKEGTVTLKVFFKERDEESISLCFSVKDTGEGIRKEDIPQVFDKFKRLNLDKNRNVEGAGLGLNIVKQLTEQMNGEITVESEYGKGSTFTVSIPQKVVDKSEIGDYEASVGECSKDRKAATKLFTAPEASVLVVDDNSMNLTLMKALLKRTQIQVDTAKGGLESLDLTRQKKYHLILMDHMMPEVDGVETLHLLRAQQSNPNKDTRVIALTANAVAGSREMYLEYGFDDYFSKPIQADKLDELLIRYLPKELVCIEEKCEESAAEEWKVPEELLVIDKKLGLSYCLNSEDIYKEILAEFCEQVDIYLPQLDLHFADKNWEQYAIITHSLKGNTMNIGATEFSKLSLQHELAGKEKNEAFIMEEYAHFIKALKKLKDEVKKMM